MPGALTLVAPVNSPRQHPREVIHAATALTITFQVRARDQVTAIDLTGLTPKFRARRDIRDTVDLFEVTGSVTSPAAGLCTVALVPSSIPDADEIWAELVLEDGAGDEIYQVAYRLAIGAGASV